MNSLTAGHFRETYSLSHVLIVDDFDANRMLLSRLVQQLGLKPILASDGAEALALFSTHRPGLVITDLCMQDMDGIELTRRIKQLAGEHFIPVILATASNEDSLIEQSLDVGWDSFIRRPFSLTLMKGKIHSMLRFARMHHKTQQLMAAREQEEQLAEQLFSRAVEQANVEDPRLTLYKRPAATFSGDVVLSARRLDGELFFLLGDFTGHGLTTTVGALPLSETFRAMVNKGYDSRQILEQINRKLRSLLPVNMFLALAMVAVSADGRIACIWNAGLPDVLLQRHDGRIERISSENPPLGILDSIKTFSAHNTTLSEGDRLLICSDGVIEARNVSDELFGDKRLLACFDQTPSAGLIDCLCTSLQTFTDGQVQSDDVSMIEFHAGPTTSVTPASVSPVSQPSAEAQAGAWRWSLELQGPDLAQANPVAQAMSQLLETEGKAPCWDPVFTILTELYINALDHGILGLESSLKHSADGFMEYFKQREARLGNLNSGSVQISMQLTRFAEQQRRLDIRIIDSGPGFDVSQVLARQASSQEQPQLMGRGIQLVSSLCSSVEYFDNGSSVHAVYETL